MNNRPIPLWLTRSLQGLTFWIGYKRSLYRDYSLSESALGIELRSLLHANLPDELFLKCEISYSKLRRAEIFCPEPIAGRRRADFVVASKVESKTSKRGWKYKPEFVFELKRAEASQRLINQDLARLAALQTSREGVRTFLLVLSEAGRHDRFVKENGMSRTGTHTVPGFSGRYSVRRTVKATSAFNNKEIGNYASIVEVFSENGKGE